MHTLIMFNVLPFFTQNVWLHKIEPFSELTTMAGFNLVHLGRPRKITITQLINEPAIFIYFSGRVRLKYMIIIQVTEVIRGWIVCNCFVTMFNCKCPQQMTQIGLLIMHFGFLKSRLTVRYKRYTNTDFAKNVFLSSFTNDVSDKNNVSQMSPWQFERHNMTCDDLRRELTSKTFVTQMTWQDQNNEKKIFFPLQIQIRRNSVKSHS